MGKFTTGEKPKFDLITASKTKKYKIITAVILVVGLLMLGGGLLFRGLVTSAVAPNSLQIDMLSNLQGNNCTISKNQLFCLSTGTVEGRALSQPIIFELKDGAEDFLEVWDAKETQQLTTSHYPGMFWLHIKDDAPQSVNKEGNDVNPSGRLIIRCGSHVLEINFTYIAE